MTCYSLPPCIDAHYLCQRGGSSPGGFLLVLLWRRSSGICRIAGGELEEIVKIGLIDRFDGFFKFKIEKFVKFEYSNFKNSQNPFSSHAQ